MSVISHPRNALSYAIRRSGVVLFAPQTAYLGAYLVVYIASLWMAARGLGPLTPVVVGAISLGLASILVGVSVGWRRWGGVIRAEASVRPELGRPLLIAAVALSALGLLAAAAYLVRIGGIPLAMPGAEQARIEASERGGAPLRVLALVALPGTWLIVGDAVRRGRALPMAMAVCLVGLVAGTWILTANRAPAFMTVEVALVVALTSRGLWRIRWRFVGLLGLAAVTAVLAAGIIGAVRLGSAPAYGPPAPGQLSVPSPPRDYPRLVAVAISGYAVVPVQNLRSTLDAVPERVGWRLGLTYLQPLLTVMPGRQTTFDADLKAALGQRYQGGGTVPGLLGESYANFGPIGWAIVPGTIALVLVGLMALARRENTVSTCALYGFCIVQAANGTISGVVVASPFPYLAIAILALAAIIEGRRRGGRGTDPSRTATDSR